MLNGMQISLRQQPRMPAGKPCRSRRVEDDLSQTAARFGIFLDLQNRLRASVTRSLSGTVESSATRGASECWVIDCANAACMAGVTGRAISWLSTPPGSAPFACQVTSSASIMAADNKDFSDFMARRTRV